MTTKKKANKKAQTKTVKIIGVTSSPVKLPEVTGNRRFVPVSVDPREQFNKKAPAIKKPAIGPIVKSDSRPVQLTNNQVDKIVKAIGKPAKLVPVFNRKGLGVYIRMNREKKGLTYYALANLTNMKIYQLQAMENNTKSYTIDSLIKVLKALEVNITFN